MNVPGSCLYLCLGCFHDKNSYINAINRKEAMTLSNDQKLRMVSQTAPASAPVPDPSTYRQVLKNMRAISDLLKDIDSIESGGGDPSEGIKISEIIKDLQDRLAELERQLGGEVDSELLDKIRDILDRVDEIEGTITEPTGPKDVVTTTNGNKVLGVHVNVKNSEVNNLIADYQQGVTWEFKNIKVIGADGLEGMSGTHCTVMTVKQDSLLEGETAVDARPSQVAYSTEGMFFYRRYSNADGTWGPWEEQDLGDDFHFQIVESYTTPEGQLPGEYWMQPIGEEATADYQVEMIGRTESDPTDNMPDGMLITDDRNDSDYALETLTT